MSSTRRNRHTYSQKREEENLTLIGWVSQIYGVLWATWIALYVNQLLTCVDENIYSQNPYLSWLPGISIPGSGLLFVVYTFFLIRWLWSIRRVEVSSSAEEFLRKYSPGVFIAFLLCVAIFWLGRMCDARTASAIGIIMTSGWVVMVILVLLIGRGND